MDTDALIELIRARGVAAVVEAVRLPVEWALKEGLDLTRWHVQTAAGCALFVHLDEEGLVDGERRVLCVNADPSRRAEWEPLAEAADAPVTILMAPGGRVE